MKMKKIALMLVLSISINTMGTQLAFASEKNVPTSSIITQLEEAGVFNPDEMTDSEREAYNAAIDKQVKLEENKHEKDFDAEEFREGLVNILETENSLSNIGGSDDMIMLRAGTWVPDVCIENKYVSAAFAVAIDAVLIASGVGSVQAFVRQVGTKEAKKVFTKTVKSRLKAWGCSKFAKYAGTIVAFILEVASPEDRIAEFLDSKDSIPNDGYFNFIL
ncbi:hypothetical protein DVW12_16470 [Clostridium botulinum]|nr:hypothetical protein [Clostridium botulinum]